MERTSESVIPFLRSRVHSILGIGSAYLSLSKHNKLFFNGGIDDTLEELEDKLYAKFLDYIRKFS